MKYGVRLSLALGSDRGPWPHRLEASAESGEQGSKFHAQAARRKPGKDRGAGDIGLPLWIVGARRKPDFNRLRKRLALKGSCLLSRR